MLFLLATLVAVLFVSCGRAKPEERIFNIFMENGAPVDGVRTFKVKAGDNVTVKVLPNSDVRVRLRGYDILRNVKANQVGEIVLKADKTGRFLLEEETSARPIGYLEVTGG